MKPRLINVRLDAERVRKAQFLRERGVPLSDVVREAIDERFAEIESVSRPEPAAILKRMFEEFPDPAGLPARNYDVHDRHAARAALVGRLKQRAR
jgi:hypothetical protein